MNKRLGLFLIMVLIMGCIVTAYPSLPNLDYINNPWTRENDYFIDVVIKDFKKYLNC